MFKILISMGSFKDVFSIEESQMMIKESIHSIKDDTTFDIKYISVADGGEYSHTIMKNNYRCEEIFVEQIVTPYKKNIKSSYLILEDNSAFISSSHILRISTELDRYKNPLNLTSFGLGQLIKHAINSGIKKILIGLGGTNTVDGGIGMLQALGVDFLDENNNILKPNDKKYFSGNDLVRIKNIRTSNTLKKSLQNISIESLCDGRININEMYIPSNQKISDIYDNQREEINQLLKLNIANYTNIINKYLHKNNLFVEEFYGVAGGINLSLNYLFISNMSLGIDYFIKKLDIQEQMKNVDLVITGEGKLDNSLVGKGPIGISKLAKKLDKKVLYLVGDVHIELEKLFKDNIADNLPNEFIKNGISTIISCHNTYKKMELPSNIVKRHLVYKENTHKIFKDTIKKYFEKEGIL